jgi:hemerythrin-like domain-containing protein
MLCMTYFLTAVSLEQQKLQKILDEFKHHVQSIQSDISTVQDQYFHSLEVTIKNFYRLEQQCQARKVDRYLIPAIHKTTQSTEQLLAELDSLKSSSVELFIGMQQQAGACFDKGVATMNEVYNAMQKYCDIQQAILAKEEQELVPMAQQLLPFDVWFSISAKCLADQENVKKQEKTSSNHVSPRKYSRTGERRHTVERTKAALRYAST